MKSNTLCKSGLGLLIVAGAMVPFASSIGEEGKFDQAASGTAMQSGDQGTSRMDTNRARGAGNLYEDLQRLQSAKGWTTDERGAQGPVRTDSMETLPSAGEGNFYQDLQKLQSSKGLASAERGAQGPIRTESMDTSPSAGEGNLYQDLQKLQSSKGLSSS